MKLGFIGLGLMGEAMATNLVKKSGHPVYVFDFQEEKINQLVQAGAIATGSSREVVEHADIIFTSVPKAEHVQAVHESVYEVVKKGQIFVDMSTIAPNDSIALGEKLATYGAIFLDAPVVKSRQAAIEGTLGIFVGGSYKYFENIKKYLEMLGTSVIYMGDNGKGLVMKICHNMLVGEIQNGVNEMMLLAQKNGVDWQLFKEAINSGGGKNFYLETKAQAIGNKDFTTAFSIENMYKDVHIAKKMIEAANLELPGAKIVEKVYQKAMDEALGAKDFSATFLVVENQGKGE